ncbi:MAG: hypothetical protein GXO69_09605 [Acidobacteria bacterium]|nr:hypothetical protein [Acidobacteriota bacterium]
MKKITLFTLLILSSSGVFAGHEEVTLAKPWNGYWWPMSEGMLATGKGYRDHPSTTEKYDARFNLDGKTTHWELLHHHKPDGAAWNGHCNGWSAAAVSEAEPTETVNSKGYTFYVGDLKGLWTMYYQGATGTIFRGTDGGSLDPLTFQTELQANLRDNGIPLLMDSDPTEEVWTWPIYSYTMDWTDDGDIRHVTLTVLTSTDGVMPDDVNSNYKTFSYTYDLTLSNGEPISGVWTGDSLTYHPDFCWYPETVIPGNPDGNPYVTHDNVLALVSAGYNTTEDDSAEPDNSFSAASPLPGGFIGRILNDDWYVFSMEPEESFTLSLYCNSRLSNSSNHPFEAELYDENENYLEDMGYTIYRYPLKTFTGTDFSRRFLKISPENNNFYNENYQFGIEKAGYTSVISHTIPDDAYWDNFVVAGFWPVSDGNTVRNDSDFRAVGVRDGNSFSLDNGTETITGPSFREIPLVVTAKGESPQWMKLNSMTDNYPVYSFYLSGGDGSMSFMKAENPATDLVLSHVPVEVDYWWYGIVLLNPSRFYPAAVEATLYGSDGTELSTVTFHLNPYEKKVGLFEGFFPGVSQADVSYIRFQSNEPVTASALYGTLNHKELSYVPAVSSDKWVFPVPADQVGDELSFFIPYNLLNDAANGWNGVVFVAPDDDAVSVTLNFKWVMDDNSSVTSSLLLGKHRKWVGVLEDLAPAGVDFSHLVRIGVTVRSGPVTGFYMTGDHSKGTLVSFPFLKYYQTADELFPVIQRDGLDTIAVFYNQKPYAVNELPIFAYDVNGQQVGDTKRVNLNAFELKEVNLKDIFTADELSKITSIELYTDTFVIPYVIYEDPDEVYCEIIPPTLAHGTE